MDIKGRSTITVKHLSMRRWQSHVRRRWRVLKLRFVVSDQPCFLWQINEHQRDAESSEAVSTLCQVSHVLEEARSAAGSLQKSVAKAFHSGPQQEFSMGMSAGPRPAPIPGYVRLMQSGTLRLPLQYSEELQLHRCSDECISGLQWWRAVRLTVPDDGVTGCRTWVGSACYCGDRPDLGSWPAARLSRRPGALE